jgi:hypothetical protein
MFADLTDQTKRGFPRVPADLTITTKRGVARMLTARRGTG